MARGSAARKTPEMQDMMEMYKELATPGAAHALLESLAGSWNVKSVCLMEPGGESFEHTGTSEQRMTLGGRFLEQRFEGDMAGTPFSGIGFMGYDNQKGAYVSTWMDSMGTGIHYFEGNASADGKSITQVCNVVCPVRGQLKWRTLTTIVDKDTLKFEMFTTGDSGSEEKMADMTYTRRK